MIVQPDVSICTVAAPESSGFFRLLQAVSAMGDLVEAEVVVAAPSITAAAMDKLEREFPLVKWIETKPGNRAFLRNQTLHVATGRYLAFWEPRWAVSEICLRRLVDFMDETPDTGLTAPALRDPGSGSYHTAHAFPDLITVIGCCLGGVPLFSRDHQAVFRKYSAQPLEVDWLGGYVLLARRETLDEVGGFRESFSCLEEMEWCLRIRRSGWHIHFLDDVWVCEVASENGAGSRKIGDAGQGAAITSALFGFMLRKWFF